MEKKIITKEIAIQAFKACCIDPPFFEDRESSVKSQFQRNIWQVSHKIGLIRILSAGESHIYVFPLIDNGYESNDGQPFKFEISKDEYNELEALYIGDFKEDPEYMDKLQKSISNYK